MSSEPSRPDPHQRPGRPDPYGSPPPGPDRPRPYGSGPNPYGMGPVGSGPAFAPPPQPARPQTPPPQGPRPPGPPGRGPKRSLLPAVIAIAAVGIVVLVLMIGTVQARRSEPEASSAAPTPPPSALPSSSEDSIAFTSTEGSGRLTVVSSRWTRTGGNGTATGQHLQVRVRVEASEGRISYGPQYFQVFDSQGSLYQTSPGGLRAPLEDGRLRAGQAVTGTIAFEMPRDTVTLLMSNALMETVTALRIED